MKLLVTVLLAAVLGASGWAIPPAQSNDRPDSASTPAAAEGQITPPDARDDARDTPAASPRLVEVKKILGMRASTVIFLAAVLFFVIVLFAAEASRKTPTYPRTEIDPRQ